MSHRPYAKHGVTHLKRAVRTLGTRTIDRRTAVGKALAAWRADLLADLGGLANVTTQELALVDEAVKTKLILDSVDAWLLSQPTLINKRNRALYPVVRDRQALVASLRGLLGDLGLKRRAKNEPSLSQYLAAQREAPPRQDGVAGARSPTNGGDENDDIAPGAGPVEDGGA
jgi:hypothetical protein